MKDKFIKYYIEEKKTTPVVANLLVKKLLKYEDIANEFSNYLDKRNYDFENALEIEGYTAKKISEISPLDASGVYAFMVTLRDDKEKALETVRNGFPRK